MTEIEKQALALVNEARAEAGRWSVEVSAVRGHSIFKALCRALEQKAAIQAEFDQHKRDVSDAVEAILNCTNINKRYGACLALNRFIMPKPRPDPLVEALREVVGDGYTLTEEAKALRAALASRGLKIAEAE